MLSDLAECAGVLVSQDLFHLLDQLCLRGQRASRDDEGLARVLWQAFCEMLLDTLRTIVQSFEVCRFPETGKWVLC